MPHDNDNNKDIILVVATSICNIEASSFFLGRYAKRLDGNWALKIILGYDRSINQSTNQNIIYKNNFHQRLILFGLLLTLSLSLPLSLFQKTTASICNNILSNPKLKRNKRNSNSKSKSKQRKPNQTKQSWY